MNPTVSNDLASTPPSQQDVLTVFEDGKDELAIECLFSTLGSAKTSLSTTADGITPSDGIHTLQIASATGKSPVKIDPEEFWDEPMPKQQPSLTRSLRKSTYSLLMSKAKVGAVNRPRTTPQGDGSIYQQTTRRISEDVTGKASVLEATLSRHPREQRENLSPQNGGKPEKKDKRHKRMHCWLMSCTITIGALLLLILTL